MAEFLLHPVTATLIVSAGLVTVQVLGQAALARLAPEQAMKWPARAQTALLGVLLAVVVVPTINNLWAERRTCRTSSVRGSLLWHSVRAAALRARCAE